jgi:hypothetical protein
MNKSASRTALSLVAISLTVLLAACVCRPIRIDMDKYSTPSTIAELKATLP